MGLELTIQSPDGSTKVVDLKGHRLTLGRAADNDLVYPQDSVLSKHHLALEADGPAWYVEDLGSKNGTQLNGKRLTSRQRLKVGDRIAAGRLSLTLRDPALEMDQTVVFTAESPETWSSASVTTNLDEVVGDASGALEAVLKSPALAGTPRVQALLDAGRELDGHRPLPELFQVILDLAVTSVGARRGVLLTCEGGQLVPRAARGASFQISTAVRDRVLARKESLLIRDARQDELLRASLTIVEQRVRSLMAVPLQTKNEVIGLIYIDSPDFIRPFTSEDLTMLTVMANIAASRIENARLMEVERAQEAISRDLEQAAEIQRGLLPKSAPAVEGLDVAGSSIPCRTVGGDYIDYLNLPGGRLGVLVADVAGKGLPAALLMSSLQARVHLLAEEGSGAATLMTRLNRSVSATCPGNRFVTMFLCLIDPRTGDTAYVNAGHNPPYLLRAAGAVETLEEGGPVLGILKSFEYRAGQTRLDSGDLLVMFSDGVTEARSPADEEYGEQRLLAQLHACRARSAPDIVAHLSDHLRRFIAEAPVGDDISIVVVRRA